MKLVKSQLNTKKSQRKSRKKTSKETSKQKDFLKAMIAKEFMKALPDDLSQYKSFEVKIVTKTFHMKCENY